MKQDKHRTRIRFIFVLILVLSLTYIGKLYSVQIVSGSEYAEKAEQQYVNSSGGVYDRGTIYFQNKDGTTVPAATLQSGDIVAIDPEILADPENVYEKINAIVLLDKGTFLASANKKDDPYEVVAKQVDPADAKKINDLDIDGVSTYPEQWRLYPGDDMAAHILGFVGYQGNSFGGRTGLENYYNDVLSRPEGEENVNFFAQIFSDIQQDTSAEKHEGDIVTTIEPSVEAFLERQLQNVQDEYHSKFTGGIIMDPKTGAIYAMALNPTYNPNDLSSASDPGVFTDKLVQDVYEMGSIIKTLTMAIGLDTDSITPDETYDDTGCITVNSSRICNYDFRARGVIPMQQILSQSLNVGAAWVEHQTGNQVFSKYMLALGLGQRTGIDLPNEASGIVNNLSSPRDVEYATAAFGQGIAMTPIETIRAIATLANGGYLVTPHLVSQIRYEDGTVKNIEYPKGPQIFKTETTKEVTDMLIKVYEDALMGGTVKIPNMSVASKTGTAQIAKPDGGGYYSDEYLHSFIGYFPASNPRFIIFLYTYEPQGVEYASETLTNSFVNLTKFLINYYEIPPDR